MELGFHFDDELFENPSERSLKKEEITYQPKWCEKEWIRSAALPDDLADRVHITKYKADALYHKGEYNQALIYYSEALGSLGPSLQVGLLKQELTEAKARCLNKLGRFEQALTLAHELVEFQGEEASYWFLVAELNRNLRNTDGELKALQRCINLHTWNANFWFSLAQAYETAAEVSSEITQSQTVTQPLHTCMSTSGVVDSRLDVKAETLHKKTYCCQCHRREHEVISLSVHPNELNDNEAFHTYMSTCNNKRVGAEERSSCDNAACVGRFSNYAQSHHTCSCSSENTENNVVELGESSSANSSSAGCCFKSSKDVNEFASDLSRVYFPSGNITQVSRMKCCRHSRNYIDKRSFSYPNDCTCNLDSPVTLPLPVQHFRQERFHLFSYCCLIRASRFLLKKACETSASFVRENINRVARQVDDKISTHHSCKCQDVLHLITQRLTSEKTEKESQGQIYTANETTDCKVMEAGPGRDTDFEEQWFGMLHI